MHSRHPEKQIGDQQHDSVKEQCTTRTDPYRTEQARQHQLLGQAVLLRQVRALQEVLEAAALQVAKSFGAKTRVIRGQQLLKQNFPLQKTLQIKVK